MTTKFICCASLPGAGQPPTKGSARSWPGPAADAVVEATLGFLLAMFRDRVDEELVRILDAEFPEEEA